MMKKLICLICLLLFSVEIEAKLPEITPKQATERIQQIMSEHATHKKLTPELVKRILVNFLEELDPTKTYFIESDIKEWLEPSEDTVNTVMQEFNNSNFQIFDQIFTKLGTVIPRHNELEAKINIETLSKHVDPDQFKDMKWVTDVAQLQQRLIDIKALQYEGASKLSPAMREKSFQRIKKRQAIFEEEILQKDPIQRQKLILSDLLKASAMSLDSHTAYFTPDEAAQFMINVQQRLFGIGAQLRDDINGFTVIKIIEGGPAAEGKELKVKDRIIAVNGEPVVGMDIIDAVELIRGEKKTAVVLTVIRESKEGGNKVERTLDVHITRNEVVLKETRYEYSLEDFGDGAIGYLKLYSFYQDPDSSSAEDLSKAIEEMSKKANLKAIMLDLRFNSGGMLSQAVDVSGLFISKGIVVSIKDENGSIQHLRHLDDHVAWKGPLVVLVNRASASASEIVAGTLQDYGRAIIIGDDHSYGKGSFQTFTLNAAKNDQINPKGEYKVTRGRYYTVSGRTPQLTGVYSDIMVPGTLSEAEVGESFTKFPLENDSIKEGFDDDLDDVPANQRDNIRLLYKYNLQPKLDFYDKYLTRLISNSAERIKNNKVYQEFLKELKKKDKEKDAEKEAEIDEENNEENNFSKADLQLTESYNIVRDLLYLMLKEHQDPKEDIVTAPRKES